MLVQSLTRTAGLGRRKYVWANWAQIKNGLNGMSQVYRVVCGGVQDVLSGEGLKCEGISG